MAKYEPVPSSDASTEESNVEPQTTTPDDTITRQRTSPSKTGSVVSEPLISQADELEIKKLLGEGGMGAVYLAHEPRLQRNVAMKVLSEELASEASHRQAFVNEAQVSAGLQHPGIVPVYAISNSGGRLHFTMQAVSGENFGDWMRSAERPLGSRERLEPGLEIFMKICDALAFAHSRGVLHCDLKPENVMVGDHGRVYLMDWGLCRRLGDPASQTAAGTPAYMSPEQARTEPIDERSDVFGLGAILFELIAGEPPYGQRSARRCMARAIAGNVTNILTLVRGIGVSRRLCRVASKAVSPHRADRHPTVSALRDEVYRFLRAGFHLPRQAFRAGELILKQGDAGTTAFIIVSGRCRVFRQVAGVERTLRHIGAGEVFGELALLLDSPRTASVQVEEDCTVLVIDPERLETSDAMEGWTAALLRALAQRFRELEGKLED